MDDTVGACISEKEILEISTMIIRKLENTTKCKVGCWARDGTLKFSIVVTVGV